MHGHGKPFTRTLAVSYALRPRLESIPRFTFTEFTLTLAGGSIETSIQLDTYI